MKVRELLITILVFSNATSVSASTGFSAAEYFETIGAQTKRGNWPARVTFESIEIKEDRFDLRGVWRVFIACSGRPIREEASRQSTYADGYHYGGNMMIIGEPDEWWRMTGRKFSLPLPTAPRKKAHEVNEDYIFRSAPDDDGSVFVSLNGVDLHTYRIREQGGGEIVLMAERSLESKEFRDLCEPGEADQFIMARVPDA